MRTSIFLSSTVTGLAAAAPFSFPLANGFPNLNSTAMQEVYRLAGGTLPNGALPTTLKPDAIQTLQLIAANELFETAYFTELLSNVTNHVPGYDVENYDYVVKTLTAVVNVRCASIHGRIWLTLRNSKNKCMFSQPTAYSLMQMQPPSDHASICSLSPTSWMQSS